MRLDDVKDDHVREAIRDALELRKEARALEEEADTLKKTANASLEQLLLGIPECKIETEDHRLALTTMTRSTFDKEQAKLLLVENGVAANVVADVFDAATTAGAPVTSVRFEVKKKGGW